LHVDQFILRIIILLLPGVAGYKVYRQLKSSTGLKQKTRQDWEYFLNILLFSLAGYLVTWAGAELINCIRNALPHQTGQTIQPIQINAFNALLSDKVDIGYLEIAVTVVIALLLGIGGAWATNIKLAFKIFNAIGITRHFSDDDVWSYLMDLKDLNWVLVRDHKLNLVYYAQINLFSDSGEKRELYLENVQVYDSSWEKLYIAENLYISRDDYDLSIELIPEKIGENGPTPELAIDRRGRGRTRRQAGDDERLRARRRNANAKTTF
jgi:hypothetical protein